MMDMKRDMEGEVTAHWTQDGLYVEMPDKMDAELEEIVRSKYGIGIEEAIRRYIQWIVDKPDEFKRWIEEIRKDEKSCRIQR